IFIAIRYQRFFIYFFYFKKNLTFDKFFCLNKIKKGEKEIELPFEQLSEMDSVYLCIWDMSSNPCSRTFYIRTRGRGLDPQTTIVSDKKSCNSFGRSNVTITSIHDKKKYPGPNAIQQCEMHLTTFFQYINWKMNETIPVHVAFEAIHQFSEHYSDPKGEYSKEIGRVWILKKIPELARSNFERIIKDKELTWPQIIRALFSFILITFFSNENIKLEDSSHLYKSICEPQIGDPMIIATKLQAMMTSSQLQLLQSQLYTKVIQPVNEIEKYRHLLWYNLFSISTAHPKVNEHVQRMQEKIKLTLKRDRILELVEMELVFAASINRPLPVEELYLSHLLDDRNV
ncbi:hypothetical protein RFI_32505, partial [Reticulomyxa filosa]